MDDILKFLLIAGVIAFGIFRQFKKDEANKSEKKAPMPTPDFDYEPEMKPEYMPAPPVIKEFPKKKISAYKPIVPPQAEGTRTTAYTPISPPPPSELNEEAEKSDSEFAIHSHEEARRAIIWSEILQRKY